MKVAYIEAGWHREIIEQGKYAFVENLRELNEEIEVEFFEAPGSLEIPLLAKLLAEKGDYEAIVCAGLIVNGGIYRHEFVATAVINGISAVSLECKIPVLSMVLTPINFNENESIAYDKNAPSLTSEEIHHFATFGLVQPFSEEAVSGDINIPKTPTLKTKEFFFRHLRLKGQELAKATVRAIELVNIIREK